MAISDLTPQAALAASLKQKQQRLEIEDMGRRLSIPIVFLKGAWAEPVLYGGVGARWGTDIDILVRPRHFGEMAKALNDAGYPTYVVESHRASNIFWGKERTFSPKDNSGLYVDLHQRLVDEPWFCWDTEEIFERVQPYPSVDGPIWSLGPEDQIVYAAAHYASHAFDWDDRHLQDMRLLAQRYPIDWSAVVERAHRAGLGVALYLLAKKWQDLSSDVRAIIEKSTPTRLQTQALNFVLPLKKHLGTTAWQNRFDALMVMPLASQRWFALPRFVATYAFFRVLDRFQR